VSEYFMEFGFFMLIGFLAQLVDGAIGMAYGVISMSILLALGIVPDAASASIHAAVVCTSGVSGLSHAMFKNIDYRLFKRLILPGIIGSIIGAFLLTKIPIKIIKPIIAGYLLLMGCIILYRSLRKMHWMEEIRQLINKALKREKHTHHLKRLIPLGLIGGFCDAIGGGGWGPVVTSSLLAQGHDEPRYTVGTVNLTEFLVSLSASMTFFMLIGFDYWQIILGLILGGVIAAPLAAIMVRYFPAKVLMFLAGVMVLLVGISAAITTFFF
jgi:uncharacterized protein